MGSFWLPPAASATTDAVDPIFYFLLYLTSFFFFLIIAVTFFFIVRYRKRSDNQKTSALHGNLPLEIAWSVIPAILLVVIFVWGFNGFMALHVPPGNSMDVRVTAQKWQWSFDYPKDGVSSTVLKVPAGQPVRLTMSAVDVLHSFYVPDFRIKADVIPNRYTVLWFQADRPGSHQVMCAEYCGRDHSRMLTKVEVVPEKEYRDWLAGQKKSGLSLVDLGKEIFAGKGGCKACHSVDGSRLVGPSVKGVYGKEETLADGRKITVDDEYIRKSLMNPMADIVATYPPAMPPYAGRLDDEEVNALIEYLKSLADQPKE